jgi:hypothetical protein
MASRMPAVRVSAEAETHRLLKFETPYMIGEDFVLALQTALAAKGFDSKADGIYGPLTAARVRIPNSGRFERDGIVGPSTRATLGLSLGLS